MDKPHESSELRRWRLLLGGGECDGTGYQPGGEDLRIDQALAALYDPQPADRRGGLEASSPRVARWLDDIRTFFPSDVVRILQQDALERLNLKRLLLEPELLQTVEPDVNLVATLMSLRHLIPAKTKDTARQVVRKMVDQLLQKLSQPMEQAVRGSLHRSSRSRRPRAGEIDWDRTIRQNLKNYQPEYRTIIPETLHGYSRRRKSLRDVILCIDQSGSMASSVVYSGIFGCVMASMPALSTRMVVFDTAVVDLTEDLKDPVDLLFGVQLGGGTDIHAALSYVQGLVTRPQDTVMVLITDLYEGGNENEMKKRAAALVSSGVQLIVLLALSDDGAPSYDHRNAAFFAGLGAPVFACTPALFPDLMGAALSRQDLQFWAAGQGINLKH